MGPKNATNKPSQPFRSDVKEMYPRGWRRKPETQYDDPGGPTPRT
jgi:hypothetical protein